MRLSLNFPLSEFQDASHHPLTDEEIRLAAQWWAPVVLQPARNELGKMIVTSYARSIPGRVGGGTHRGGDALDVVPLEATLTELWDWYRARPWLYGQLLLEPDHIHMTRPGVNGKWGEVLVETAPGQYQFGGVVPSLLPVLLLVAGLLLVWIA